MNNSVRDDLPVLVSQDQVVACAFDCDHLGLRDTGLDLVRLLVRHDPVVGALSLVSM